MVGLFLCGHVAVSQCGAGAPAREKPESRFKLGVPPKANDSLPASVPIPAFTGFCRMYSHFSFKLSSDRST